MTFTKTNAQMTATETPKAAEVKARIAKIDYGRTGSRERYGIITRLALQTSGMIDAKGTAKTGDAKLARRLMGRAYGYFMEQGWIENDKLTKSGLAKLAARLKGQDEKGANHSMAQVAQVAKACAAALKANKGRIVKVKPAHEGGAEMTFTIVLKGQK